MGTAHQAPPGQTMQRSSSLTMEAVRDLSSTLWTIRTNQETSRIYRTTHSILRFFLLPWLFFFLLVIGLLTMNIIRDLWCHHIQWRHVFLFFATMFIFTSWRHMQKQFLVMSLPRPFPVSPDVEAVVREALKPLPIQLAKDAPPRYEEVETEELPPGYDEATRKQMPGAALS